jgi:hypothetical protein
MIYERIHWPFEIAEEFSGRFLEFFSKVDGMLKAQFSDFLCRILIIFIALRRCTFCIKECEVNIYETLLIIKINTLNKSILIILYAFIIYNL